MLVTILGKRWNLVYEPLDGRTNDGFCERPDTPRKRMVVNSRLKGEKRLATEIHEMLHAADWHKDEEWVTAAGDDIAKILWKLGYRREE